ncbi:MAG: response regulator [Candidatus Omnitrophica bacterium]|nr:response regulator [Candidatus Omnitrophota bacterium]
MKKKILVVDDEKDMVGLVVSRLKVNGYVGIPAYSGKGCLEKVSENIPDLIILDIVMPDLNGSTICGILKYDSRYKKIPIIILTAKKRAVDKEIGHAVKADAFFTKPFDSQELLAQVKRLLAENPVDILT